MLETIGSLDRALFLWLNVDLANPVADFIMPLITSSMALRTLYGVAIVLLLWKGKARHRWLVLFSVVTLVLTDQISAGLLKPMIGRLRPCHVLENINLLVGCGGGNAMPSSHAANAFGQAILFGLLYRSVRWPLLALAALIAVSRVFVGAHYPADVLAGALLGAVIAVIVVWRFNQFSTRMAGSEGG